MTGSNAFLQSSDLATLFVGRTYEVHILPFSFKEYLSYFPSSNIYDGLTKYITEGGMAGSYPYKELNQKYRYINTEVLNALVVRDIVEKYKIRNEPLLHVLIDFLMDNIGNEVSVRSITDSLSGNKTGADHKTIGKYIEYLCNAFAFYRVRRYDIKGKKYLRSTDKMKQGNKFYIQVSYDITERMTFDREVGPLLRIGDAYPKIIIARTYQPEYQHEGIRIIDAAEWLSGEDKEV